MRSLTDLSTRGQSPWYDNLSRTLISSGELADLLSRGVVGVTSNPTIFDQAISSSSSYDDALRTCLAQGKSAEEAYWDLVCDDIAAAADVLRDVYDRTQGADGYVSVEVSPLLARDAAGTIAQANELFARISRDNVMIKIPATSQGLEAITAVLANSIPVNVTLIFSQARYVEVVNAYKEGVKLAQESGATQLPRSVASFFISRLDTKIDAQLDESSPYRGKGAIANAGIVYGLFEELFGTSDRETAQRPLWASTSTKNPAYSPTLYVDSLIAPYTVNTLPHATIEAVEQSHDDYPSEDLSRFHEEHSQIFAQLEKLVPIDAIMKELEDEGVDSFEKSYLSCISSITTRLDELSK